MIANTITKITLILVRFYRVAISPYHPPVCRFTPTCSQYAEEAIGRYGAAAGLRKAAGRLLRCHPFSRGGYDPVR